MTTQVCITIDTEFSIGGAFRDPVGRRPVAEANVDCPAEGRDNGLPFLLETFRNYGIAATFFVEALNTAYFGDAPMGRIVERILAAGQDVQLHIHPSWLAFEHADWISRFAHDPPNDQCDNRKLDELCNIIRRGIAALGRFGVAHPIAMRTGNLRADLTTYAAMHESGLHLASNIGAAVFRPSDPQLQLNGGRCWIGDVLEVPVLSYQQTACGWRILRLLTITASSWAETERLLWCARAARVPTIVLLTHPFEFIKGDRLDPERVRINRVNQARLLRLCAFIAAHPAEFAAVSFAQAGPAWLREGDVEAPSLGVPLRLAALRAVQNKANDLFAFV
jgi:hypothetical protein